MITQQYLKECLYYDSETGIFTWLARPREHFKTLSVCAMINRKYQGMVAGTRQQGGRSSTFYIQIRISNKFYKAHRLAWLYQLGVFPPEEIDHIDGDGRNNRWANLRSVTGAENRRNMPMHPCNTTGMLGVTLRSGRFSARITVAGKNINLGCFGSLVEASAARMAADVKYGFHVNHGRTA